MLQRPSPLLTLRTAPLHPCASSLVRWVGLPPARCTRGGRPVGRPQANGTPGSGLGGPGCNCGPGAAGLAAAAAAAPEVLESPGAFGRRARCTVHGASYAGPISWSRRDVALEVAAARAGRGLAGNDVVLVETNRGFVRVRLWQGVAAAPSLCVMLPVVEP